MIPSGSPKIAGGEYAIHGTNVNVPGSVGGFVSYGCIRMLKVVEAAVTSYRGESHRRIRQPQRSRHRLSHPLYARCISDRVGLTPSCIELYDEPIASFEGDGRG